MTTISRRRAVQTGRHEANPRLRNKVSHARRAIPFTAVRRPVQSPPSGLKLVDELPTSIPVSTRELEVLETYLSGIIDGLLG
jgi:hypothetical protein